MKESDLPAHRAREGPASFIFREGKEEETNKASLGPYEGSKPHSRTSRVDLD